MTARTSPYSMSLVFDVELARLVAHRPDCPAVEQARRAGVPLMTLFECENPPPENVERHACFESPR